MREIEEMGHTAPFRVTMTACRRDIGPCARFQNPPDDRRHGLSISRRLSATGDRTASRSPMPKNMRA